MTTAYETVQHEIDAKVAQLVAKSAGLSLTDALCEVMRDPELYARYTQAVPDPTATTVAKAEAPPVSRPVAAAVLEPELRRVAAAFAPEDPWGQGLVLLKRALGELESMVQRRRRPAA